MFLFGELLLPLLLSPLLVKHMVQVGDGEEERKQKYTVVWSKSSTFDKHVDEADAIDQLFKDWCTDQVFKGHNVERMTV